MLTNATCLCLGEGHLTSPTAWIAFLFKRKQFQLWLIGQLGYNPFYRLDLWNITYALSQQLIPTYTNSENRLSVCSLPWAFEGSLAQSNRIFGVLRNICFSLIQIINWYLLSILMAMAYSQSRRPVKQFYRY